jgi:hypothetical protein
VGGVNRLAQETSPYLLQHADNPVDWYPWGDEAFSKARADDKPVLLSVGYAACHWCHVMEHESFEDDETAALMNERFVSVKVDREERPDVDSLYMDAVVALTGQGGWPMTVFLTPDGEPFLGGTYYPPEPRHGLPSFQQVLTAVSDAYRDRRGDVSRQASAIVDAVRQSAELRPSTDPLSESMLGEATRALERQFDREWGGWGGAPKFPPASTLEFLLRMHLRDNEVALPMVTQTLDAMAAGGMYDLVGGGFHRYSVDREWLVPHFEKMLYDNALLAAVYLHGWVVTGDERYRRVTEETLDYMLRELLLPEGGFASAQDADTDGVEGLTFTWRADEGVREELLQPFEDGRSVIRGALSADEQARLFRELPDHLASMALFAVNTGCRDGEVCGLRWEWEVQVPELGTSVFLIPGRHVKNGDERLVVLNDVALSIIRSRRDVDATHVFTFNGKPIRYMLNSGWRTARQKAGLNHVRVHDLKHTFGRRLRAAGASFEDRQDLLGHRSTRITSHYSAVELRRLIDAANRVCQRVAGTPEVVVVVG